MNGPQAMMNRCTMAASEFTQLFDLICKNCNIQMDTYTKSEKQRLLILTASNVLEKKCNMKIVKVFDEEHSKRVSSLILINRTDRSRDTNKLTIKGWYLLKTFLSLLKKGKFFKNVITLPGDVFSSAKIGLGNCTICPPAIDAPAFSDYIK